MDTVTAANLNLETDYQAPSGRGNSRSSKPRASISVAKEDIAHSSEDHNAPPTQTPPPLPAVVEKLQAETPQQASPKKATGRVRLPSRKEPSGGKDKDKKTKDASTPTAVSTPDQKVATPLQEKPPIPKPRTAPTPPPRQESSQSAQSQDTYSLTSVEVTTPTLPSKAKQDPPERELSKKITSPPLAKVEEENKSDTVEAVIHNPRPTRFAGQGRISQGNQGNTLYSSQVRRPLISEDDEKDKDDKEGLVSCLSI